MSESGCDQHLQAHQRSQFSLTLERQFCVGFQRDFLAWEQWGLAWKMLEQDKGKCNYSCRSDEECLLGCAILPFPTQKNCLDWKAQKMRYEMDLGFKCELKVASCNTSERWQWSFFLFFGTIECGGFVRKLSPEFCSALLNDNWTNVAGSDRASTESKGSRDSCACQQAPSGLSLAGKNSSVCSHIPICVYMCSCVCIRICK